MFRRSVEVDPNFTFGHASIALVESSLGHEETAMYHLKFVTQAETITPETAVISSLARINLAIKNHNLEAASLSLDMAVQIDPDHYLIERYQKKVKEEEEFEEKFGLLIESQRKKGQRAYQKLLNTHLTAEMGLRSCLETYPKDMLTGSATFLRTSASGNKEELVFRLEKNLLFRRFLRQTLYEDLGEKERDVLLWILEMNGVRPWKEFTEKYGDSHEEPAAWRDHEPESLNGRLRMSGLFYTGMLEGNQVVFIPTDLRPLLQKLLKK